jgi:hypothetical protein
VLELGTAAVGPAGCVWGIQAFECRMSPHGSTR